MSTQPAPTRHCPGCGEPIALHGGPSGSAGARRGCLPELDPPRYCTDCGGWLAVRVSTGGWLARCRRCGAEERGG